MIRIFHPVLFCLPLLLFANGLAAGRSSPSADEEIPLIRLHVVLDVPSRRAYGRAEIKISEGRPLRIETGELKLDRITLAGNSFRPAFDRGGFRIEAEKHSRTLRMRFSGHFPSRDDSLEASSSNFIAHDGAVLIDNWHPRVAGLARYQLTATVHASFQAMSEADAVTVRSGENRRTFTFDFSHPRTEVSLVVGPYAVLTDKHGGIELATYFFPEDQNLAKSYLEKAKEYLDRYEALLGPYPYRRFAIVENRRPTGYGMATYTLIGQQIVRLPFIVDTSFGHEILHSWFGNSVYLDPDDGNWSEGLTTYLSDHLYEADKGKGWAYRHRVLVEYRSYVHRDKAIPLRRFKSRSDKASQTIGYGKGAMFFHMLRRQIGDDPFFEALRLISRSYRFRQAGWAELRAAFDESSKQDLGGFFQQWLLRADIPVLTLKRRTVSPLEGSRYRVTVALQQRNAKPYDLTVPVVVETARGASRHNVVITGADQSATLEVDGKPLAVVLDPDYDVLREPGPEEYPPVLSRLLGAERGFIFAPASQKEEIYRPVIGAWRRRGFRVLAATEIAQQDPADASFLILGSPDEPFRRLAENLPPVSQGVQLTVRENPFNPREVIAVLQASEESDIARIVPKLSHYGQYGALRFEGGRLVEKKKPPFERGLRLALEGEILGVAARDLSSLEQIIRQVALRKVIYVGERHDRYGHHLAQLELIKGLVLKGQKVAVGMEMFQRPYQPIIDQYLSGTIDERTFLARTEYFERWKFDYHLYRSIVQYCKEQGLPLVALNLQTEIVQKVARQGLEALTEEEKRQIPEELDLSNDVYRERLKRIFDQHPQTDVKDFETFYQSQVLWDETMAQSVHDYLESHPDYQMVVLAGSGHLAFGDGIPSRVRKRGGHDQAIILNIGDEEPAPEMADYFLYPPEVTPPFTAKLGVHVTEKDGQISVVEVPPRGPAKTAGLREGDLLLAIDGESIQTLADLRLALFFKKAEESARLRVKRAGALLPDEILEVTVGPFRSSLAVEEEPVHEPVPKEGKHEPVEKGSSSEERETFSEATEQPTGNGR